MRRKSGNKGMTLVEIIVALAILGILAVAFLPVFATAFKWVAVAGNRSEQLYGTQNTIENKILQGSVSTAANMQMVFKDSLGAGDIPISVLGEDVVNESIQMFLPSE